MTRNLYLGLALILATMFCTYKLTSHYYQAQIATIKLEHKTAELEAEKASANRLLAAQSLADVLSSSLANTEAELNKTTLEKTREIHHYATGNVCFNSDLTKLLNTGSVSEITSMSEASSTSTAEDEALRAIETQADTLTDTDVAEWVANAQGQYEACRGRLGALIDFNTTDFQTKKAKE